ncbi:hypothetical protein Pmani_037790 [Petrolisthes manimaculis]|uniref:C2H2-type domain-containing protein n=2 Tax=Petrolisthes manimaculis TaxID=1843537 RepID=A0AAE1NFM1_9EUCA|nr:hypothetical protein Pmani_037790 [Petrolisthes manimaculis]
MFRLTVGYLIPQFSAASPLPYTLALPSPSSSSPSLSLSPPSPNTKPSPDLLYMSGLKGVGFGQPHSISQLELLTRVLTHRAMAHSHPHDSAAFDSGPLDLTSLSPLHHSTVKQDPHNTNSAVLDIPRVAATSSTHNGGLIHVCQRCGKGYGVRRSLHRHQKFECGVEPKFECPVCNKKCTHKFNLKQHMLSHHKYGVEHLQDEQMPSTQATFPQ